MFENPNQEKVIMQKINITLQENVIVVRFMEEDLQNPPFFLHNLTPYDIYFRQKLTNRRGSGKLCCCCGGQGEGNNNNNNNYSNNVMKQLYPGDLETYTWEQWIVDKHDHILEVDVEGHREEYNIDKIQDYKPIPLKRRNANNKNKEYQHKKVNKKYLFKKGILIWHQDRFEEENNYREELLGILDVYKQVLELYYTKNRTNSIAISLEGAKVEEGKNNEFIISKGSDVKIFQAQDEKNCKEWIEYAWRAILANTPDLVQFKIEPMNHTKVLTFYMSKFNNENTDDFIEGHHVKNNSSLSIDITNTIGISIVDCIPREIMQISLKKLKIQKSTFEEYMMEDEASKYIDDENNLQDKDTSHQNMTVSQSISQPTMITNYQLQSTTANMHSNMTQQGSTIVKQLTDKTQNIQKKIIYSVTLDYLIINNQLKGCQFPVIFAPNRKKDTHYQDLPFLNLSIIQKELMTKNDATGGVIISTRDQKDGSKLQQQNTSSNNNNNNSSNQNIKYIQLFNLFMDTIEIRIDDYFIEAVVLFVNQILPNFKNSQQLEDLLKFDFSCLPHKIQQKLENNLNQNKANQYIKNMKFDPIEICLTFRSSPGHQMHASTQNLISNFGLTLVSIDSAKIKLNSLFFNHVFGQMGEIGRKIGSHYTTQILSQLYRIFGSFELLGNPVNLIENLGTGVIDMFYDPIKAVKKGKGGFKATAAFVQGTYKLIANTIHSVWTTVNTIINTIMKLLTSITLHKQYMHERQNRQNRHIRNFKDGIIIGIKNFISILWEAFSGLIMRPIREAQERGLLGFFIGIWQGLTGVLIKPVVGTYDMIITIAEGMLNHSKYEESIMEVRSRPPRIFGSHNIIVPFDFVPAVGRELIQKYKIKNMEHDSILHYEEVQINNSKTNIGILVVTDIRVIYAKKRSTIDYKKLELCKVKSVIYKERSNKLTFQTDVPISTGCCKSKQYQITLKYSNLQRAKLLMAKLKYYFIEKKLYDLDFQIYDNQRQLLPIEPCSNEILIKNDL